MENVATHEDWKVCFASLAPGLLLFARQLVRSRADAEGVVQEALEQVSLQLLPHKAEAIRTGLI